MLQQLVQRSNNNVGVYQPNESEVVLIPQMMQTKGKVGSFHDNWISESDMVENNSEEETEVIFNMSKAFNNPAILDNPQDEVEVTVHAPEGEFD